MSWLQGVRHLVRSLVRRRSMREERDEELAFHVRMESEHLRREGMSEPSASAIARARVVDVTEPARWTLDSVWLDLRHAGRALGRARTFTVTAVFTLVGVMTVSIVTVAMLSALYLRALPFQDDHQLVTVQSTDADRPAGFNVSLPNFRDWSSQKAFSKTAVWDMMARGIVATGLDAQRGDIVRVAGDFFGTLGVRPAIGRAILPSDEQDETRMIVLSDRLWRGMFGGDRAILGRRVHLDGIPHTVIGVMSADFRFPASALAWASWPATMQQYMPRSTVTEQMIARLAPGHSPAMAQRELAGITARLHAEFPGARDDQATGAIVTPLRRALFGAEGTLLLLLGGAVVCALLTACANLACANLARAAERTGEFDIRAALGATEARLVQYWVLETLLLTATAAIVALIAAPWLLRAVWAHAEFVEFQTAQPRVDLWSIAAAAGLALLIALPIGVLPAWRSVRHHAIGAVARGGRVIAAAGWTRSILIVGEVATATMLLIGTGLALRSVARVLAQPRGFETSSVLTAELQLPLMQPVRATALVEALIDSIRRLPGVLAAGGIDHLPLAYNPLTGSRVASGIMREGAQSSDSTASGGFHAVDGDYFSAMGIPLLRGRLFTAADDSLTPRVAVVSRIMAARYWPDTNPIGQRFQAIGADQALAGQWLTVIGVVGDVRAVSLEQASLPDYYVAFHQGVSAAWQRYLVLRTSSTASDLAPPVRRLVAQLDARIPIAFATMKERVATSQSRRLFAGSALGTIGMIALALVLVGVYGVLSYTVATRAREIGLRMALGATRQQVQGEVLGAALRPVVIGVVVGVAGALALTPVLRQLVFELSPNDPMTIAASVAVIAGTAVLAGILPARRATRVDPNSALRSS